MGEWDKQREWVDGRWVTHWYDDPFNKSVGCFCLFWFHFFLYGALFMVLFGRCNA